MKPTVLIGLGGIGSQAVDRIYGMMSDEQKRQTASAVLDTDIGDLQKLKNIDIRIQTSPSVKVGNYIYSHQNVIEWFPHTYTKINNMMLSTGAGQIRALSRLSFYSALDEGKVYVLDRAIEKLSLLDDSQYDDDVNIVIVGTISGGTCSGSFLQMGLYMRRYFQEKNPNSSVFIQGVFLLPHTIAKTGRIVESQWKNLEFNAYAALKELNAIMSPSVINKINIELEYRPGANTKINLGNRPYDNILFFDYENSRNQNLRSLEEYKSLLAETVYYAYIGPLSSEYQSKFVNEIRTFIANHQESFYSASSVNKLIYPYEDIVRYLSLEWIIEEIDSEWLEFDKQYDAEIKEWDKDRDKGINRAKPKISDIYIDNLDRKEGEENTPFYTSILAQTRIVDEDSGEIKGTKDQAFVEAIDKHTRKALEKDKDYIGYLESCTIETENLESQSNAAEEIVTLEYNLKILTKNIDKLVDRHKNILVRDVVSQNCDRENFLTKGAHNINQWIMSGEDGVHPVAARYFLYKVRDALSRELNSLSQQVKSAKEDVDGYKKKHNIPSDLDAPRAEYYESAEEVMDMISGQTLVQSLKHMLTNNKSLQFKPFIQRFRRHYNNQKGYISQLILLKLQYGVTENILSRIETMIENWETLFSELGKSLMENIKYSRNELLHKHEEGKKDIFVFASPESKKALWEYKKNDLLGDVDSSNLSNEIGRAQFELYCKMQSPQYKNKKIKIDKETYKSLLVEAYQKALKSKIDIELDVDISKAVELESEIIKDPKNTLEEYIRKLAKKNLPWMHIPDKKLILTKFWGVSNKDVFGNYIVDGNITADSEFSDKEIVYLVMYHNLNITDFAKFAVRGTLDGGKIEGPYFQAYHELIEKIKTKPDEYVTPHIDKRWDSPAFMPDLNASVATETNKNIAKAFLYGLTEGNLYKAERDGTDYFYARRGKRVEEIKKKSKSIRASRWLDLLDALSANPAIVDSMIQVHNDLKEHSKEDPQWSASKDEFVKLVKSGNTIKILTAMLENECKDDESYDKVLGIISEYGNIISDYIKEGYGDRKETTAQEEISKTKESLIKKLSKNIDESTIEAVKSSLAL